MVKSSGSDKIHSVNNNTHDMVHFQTLAAQSLLVQYTMKVPEYLLWISRIYLFSQLHNYSCLSSYHRRRTVGSHTDSATPVHLQFVQGPREG